MTLAELFIEINAAGIGLAVADGQLRLRGPEGQPFQHDFFASSKRRAVERCLCFLS
jgi:hypothetical protein